MENFKMTINMNHDRGYFGDPFKSQVYNELQSTNNLEEIKGIRSRNERLMPTGEELMDKNFLIGLWGYIQANSKANLMDGYRYINVKCLIPTEVIKYVNNLSKDKNSGQYFNKPITRPTIIKGINYLKENGYIISEVKGDEVMGGYKGLYYKVNNDDVFKYYVLMENDFISAITSTLSQDTIKVYLIYYSFNINNQKCYLNQDEILRRVGLSASGKNYEKLRHINAILRTLGLIQQEYMIERDVTGREVNRKIVTTAPFYWNTRLYIETKKEMELGVSFRGNSIEYIKI